MSALAIANEVRTRRAAMRRAVKARERHVADLIEDLPVECHKVPAIELVSWAPRVGSYRARRLLDGLVFKDHIPIGQMEPGRRLELARRLREQVA